MSLVIGVDVGGTKIAAGLVSADGLVLDARTAPTPRTGADSILQVIIDLCHSLISASVGESIRAIGIGTAGQVDHERGVVTYANENLPGWTGTPVAERVGAALGLPVRVENDVKAMAISESHFGAGREFQHSLYLAVGTGIGGAIILNGEIWRGANGTGGEFGYILAGWDGERPVKVEEVLAGPGLAARYSRLSGTPEPLSLNAIAQRAADGDSLAVAVIREGAWQLGAVVRPVALFLDPQVLIIGGGVTGIGPLWWDSFVASVRDTPLPTVQRLPIRQAQLGAHAVLAGAAWAAMGV